MHLRQPATFPVIDITGWDAQEPEDMGARDKLWVSAKRAEGTSSHLWKQARSADALPEYGADSCAERIAAELAERMGIEAAEVELAHRLGVRGVISRRIPGELRHGNELLSDLHPGYEADRKGAVKGYDLESIATVLEPYEGWSAGFSAFDCFAGLLVFDALVGNTDRHHENWAIVEDTGTLAPSFDHGASLGFNASPRQMASPTRYSDKAKSRHFHPAGTLAQLAQDALGMIEPMVRQAWIDGVSQVTPVGLRSIVSAIPPGWMSDPRRTFTCEVVEANRRRLLQ